MFLQIIKKTVMHISFSFYVQQYLVDYSCVFFLSLEHVVAVRLLLDALCPIY
jgi:hypothetical protein